MNKNNVFAPVTLNIVHGSIKLEFHPHSADRADKVDIKEMKINKHNGYSLVTKLEFHPHSADRADKGWHNQIKGKKASGRHNQMKMKNMIKRLTYYHRF